MNIQNLVKIMIFQILAKNFQSKKIVKVKLKFRCHLSQILAKNQSNLFFYFGSNSGLNSAKIKKKIFFQSIYKF